MDKTLSKHTAYVGIGSNLDTPIQQVESAIAALSTKKGIALIKTSAWYASKAVGPGEQPDYVNGAALIETTLTPTALLDTLQAIELDHGRIRAERWGARTLDLDLLLYENVTLDTERLTIPHPQLTHRNFVIMPLLDIDKRITLPDGQKIADILPIIGTQNIKKLP